jgi:hypothetical protein
MLSGLELQFPYDCTCKSVHINDKYGKCLTNDGFYDHLPQQSFVELMYDLICDAGNA